MLPQHQIENDTAGWKAVTLTQQEPQAEALHAQHGEVKDGAQRVTCSSVKVGSYSGSAGLGQGLELCTWN